MSKAKAPLVFSTKQLPPALSQALSAAGLRYREKNFIEVFHEYNRDQFLERLNYPESQARVFTSKNAVRSLEKLQAELPQRLELIPKKTFTVGIRATEMLQDFGLKTAARADNAISLAQIIARNKDVQAVDFFCGDQSLNDLPEYLESKNIKVHREIIYHTELTHEEVDTSAVEAIIFLSPTAVYSFFKKNKIDPAVPAFCIGATTAGAVNLRCDNRRILADEPSLESVVAKIIEHFNAE